MQIGIELEYWVVDEDGALASAVELVEECEHVVEEFVDSLVELQLPPVDAPEALPRTTVDVLDAVLEVAAAHELRLVPLGTPLTEHDLPIVTDRGRLLETIYGAEIARAKNCAGTHVHFDQVEHVERQLDLLTALDPALALVSSSPYYGGRRLATSSRALQYRTHSDAGLQRYRDLWDYVESAAEWQARVEAQYDALRTIALDRGVDAEAFDRYVSPENAVLTPVRLRETPATVEWRAPDAALPSQVLQLVTDVHGLVEQTDRKAVVPGVPGVREHEIGVPPLAELRALSAAAIANGLADGSVRSYLETMGFDTAQYAPIAERITGPAEIDESTARSIRLEYAAALRAEVDALRATVDEDV